MMPAAAANKRMTWIQIQETYPHRWIGITNVSTVTDNNATIESAEVVYTDRDRSELESIQFDTDGKVRAVYTTPDDELYISSVRA
ncbi:MAG: hypothetical protein IJQ21_08380 [Lachnospiraceae bacterium]|nr:hypothetical protein [Lachnospiraceae bacterium]